MTGLRVAHGLTLPIAMVGESTAILAKKGAGKSNTAKVIVEETLDHGGVQVIVLDPIGHWWSLRAGADGKPKGGYPVAVFGGMHGDLPLEELAGKLLAQTAVESGQSMILDVSSLDSNGAMQRFVYEFLEELYRLKQGSPTPVLLVLEEADEFAPQDPKGANVPRMVGAANRISKRGRGRGIGMLYVTQRSAALNKNVLDQSDTLIVMRTIGPRDRAAIEGWVKHQQAAGMDAVLPSLPSLETGEAWVWAPERGLLERVRIRKARTFDSSQTPKPGQAAIVADVKPIDVEALGAAMAATVERAKENDPAELRTRLRLADSHNATLQRRLDELEREVRTATEIEPIRIEVPAFADGEIKRLEDAVLTLGEYGVAIVADLTSRAETVMAAAELVSRAVRHARDATSGEPAGNGERPPAGPQPAVPFAPSEPSRPAPRAPRPHLPQSTSDRAVSRPQQALLDTLAWFEAIGVAAPSRTAVGFLAKTSPKSSGFEKNLSTLRTSGLIDYPAGGLVGLTDAGRGQASVPNVPATDEALQHAIYAAVGPTKAALLSELVDHYPQASTREELAEAAGASALSSGFEKNLSTLRTLGLIDYPQRGYVVALPILFPVSGR